MNFWNRIGLPSAADIQELKEASLRQAETLSTLTELSRNVKQLLENTRDIGEKSGELTEAVHAYYEGTSQMILKRAEALSASLEPLEALRRDFQKMDKDTRGMLSQVLSECQDQKEASLRQAETLSTLAELNRNVMQLLENTRDLGGKSGELTKAVHAYYEGTSQMILKRAEALSAGLEPLETLRRDFQKMDKDTQGTLGQVLSECQDQNELLRLLAANSLIDDVFKLLDEDKGITGDQHR